VPGRLTIQDARRTEQVERDVGRTRPQLAVRHLDTRGGGEAQHGARDESRCTDAEGEPEPEGDERDHQHAGKADGDDPHRGPRTQPLSEECGRRAATIGSHATKHPTHDPTVMIRR
jgi:hypothetical protein